MLIFGWLCLFQIWAWLNLLGSYWIIEALKIILTYTPCCVRLVVLACPTVYVTYVGRSWCSMQLMLLLMCQWEDTEPHSSATCRSFVNLILVPHPTARWLTLRSRLLRQFCRDPSRSGDCRCPGVIWHEFHETCHSVTFNALVNSHQRWKPTRNCICFLLWCELTLALWCHIIVWSLFFMK